MTATARGYHVAFVEGIGGGARYRYALGADLLPDPASRAQPDGVHGDSEVVEPDFAWSDHAWHGFPLADYVIYELHVGTFTPEGTFDAAIARLDDLAELGITAIELMPVAEFPGGRNWGYDGVFPYAPQSTYGGAAGLRRLVDAAHARNLAVVLDVVYNHLGPEGNVLGAFGPYFTDRYRTPWGAALNFDGPGSDEVRTVLHRQRAPVGRRLPHRRAPARRGARDRRSDRVPVRRRADAMPCMRSRLRAGATFR